MTITPSHLTISDRIARSMVTAAKSGLHPLFSMFFRFVPQCGGMGAQTPSCRFVHSSPYQIEMLLPQCGHDSIETCRARALFWLSRDSFAIIILDLIILGS
jgi:hypothetical protein